MINELIALCGDKYRDNKIISEHTSKQNRCYFVFVLPNDDKSFYNYIKDIMYKYSIKNIIVIDSSELGQLYSETKKLNINDYFETLINLENYFFIWLSLIVAKAEVIETQKILIPLLKTDLISLTFNIKKYINCLNSLINLGTKSKYLYKLKFPLIDNFDYKEKIPKKEKFNNRATVLFSGGLDCNAAAHILHNLGYSLNLFNIQYGQSNRNAELYCIKENLKSFNKKNKINYKSINFYCIKKNGGSAMLEDKNYIDINNLDSEYVPFRNTILINLAIIYSIKNDTYIITTGSQKDDILCPDNNIEYFHAFQKVLDLQKKTNNILLYPILLDIGGKRELIYILNEMNVDFKYLWSCSNYSNSKKEYANCGTCANCINRYQAFVENSLIDPIPYKTIPKIGNHNYGWAENCNKILEKLNIPKKNFKEQ